MYRGNVDPGVSELPRGNELSRDQFSEEAINLISLSMQSYYQYFIGLVSARSIILSSESHNSVNLCPILTN